jgi:hypothetical protein
MNAFSQKKPTKPLTKTSQTPKKKGQTPTLTQAQKSTLTQAQKSTPMELSFPTKEMELNQRKFVVDQRKLVVDQIDDMHHLAVFTKKQEDQKIIDAFLTQIEEPVNTDTNPIKYLKRIPEFKNIIKTKIASKENPINDVTKAYKELYSYIVLHKLKEDLTQIGNSENITFSKLSEMFKNKYKKDISEYIPKINQNIIEGKDLLQDINLVKKGGNRKSKKTKKQKSKKAKRTRRRRRTKSKSKSRK